MWATGVPISADGADFPNDSIASIFERARQMANDALGRGYREVSANSVEVRDPELLTEDYLAALCAGRATHCIAIHARMPSAIVQARYWRDSGQAPLVIRWSLHSGFKYEEAKERYAPFNALVDEDPEGRAQVAQLVKEAAGRDQDAYVIVNNKAEGSAPLTIRKLAELIDEYGEAIVIRS